MMRTTLTKLQAMRDKGEKIAVLTCYDASFAALLEAQGVDVLLVGDSLGMVLQGHESTLPVTLDDMAYHTACVARGSKQAFIIADMPFGTFQISPQEAFAHTARLMVAGAQMAKLEGGGAMLETVRFLTERGVPVCGHIGLTPQSVHQLGGYRVQGKESAVAEKLIEDAAALEQAGAGMIVLEAIPALLAAEHHIRQALQLGTIRFQRARVLVEILVRPELQRIHKDARHDAAAVFACEAHQVEMPVVQIAHGRHEGDGMLLGQSCAQIGDTRYDVH
jgi:3-methyl-2-oxobutanoate hydroxymethyltransferase